MDMKRNKRKSSVSVKRIRTSKVEEQHDHSYESFDNFLGDLNLPALYKKAVKNVDNKVANMSTEEIADAVEAAKQLLINNFCVVKEDLVATKRKSLQPSMDKNLKKSSQKKKVCTKSSNSDENVKKSNENRTLSLRKNRRPPNRYKCEVTDLEVRLKFKWEYEFVGRSFESRKKETSYRREKN